MKAGSDLTAASWQAFSHLLDQALELAPGERLRWVDALGAEHDALKPALRSVLARGAGVETANWLGTLPHEAASLPADESDLQPGTLVGPYRLLRELGIGGMGAVWLAERADGSLKRQVALKLPRASWSRGLAERMARERDILAGLEHPNIARLYDAGTDSQGRPYLALEYVEGQSLDAYSRQLRLRVRERVNLLLQVAHAVAYAHSRLVIHRDLKPSNILITTDGQVRLLDFGIAKLMENDRAQETQLTQLAGRALTLDYASPEQVRGEPIGTASDVYSLGVVAYELLTENRPYKLKRRSLGALEDAITSVDAPIASSRPADHAVRRELRGDLDAILGRALKKRPDERYPSVVSFAEDLQRWIRNEPVIARQNSRWYVLTKLLVRHRLAVSVALLLAVVVSGSAIVALRQADQARQEAARAKAVQDYLVDLFRANTADQADPRRAQQMTARELLDAGASRIRRSLAGQPEARMILLETLGNLYGELGLWTEASDMTEHQLGLARSSYPSGDSRLIDAMLSHAMFLLGKGDTAQAGLLLSEAETLLDGRRDYSSLLRGRLTRLAANHASWTSHERALEYARQSVEIFRVHHPDNPEFVKSLRTLSGILNRRGQHALAAQFADESVDVGRKLGLPEFQLGPLLAGAGTAHLLAGNVEGAEGPMRAALAMLEHVHGEHGLATVLPRLDLARQQAAKGELVEARGLAKRALADATAPSPLGAWINLPAARWMAVDVFLNQGDYKTARTMLDEAFGGSELQDPMTLDYGILLAVPGPVLLAEDKPEAALVDLEKAIANYERLGIGPHGPARRQGERLRSEILSAMGDGKAALHAVDRLAAITVDPEEKLWLSVLTAHALAASDRLDDALQVVREARKEASQLSRLPKDLDAEIELTTAELASRRGECAAALPGYRRSADIFRKIHVPDSPYLLKATSGESACSQRKG